MIAVLLHARSDLRRRWRAWLSLTMLVVLAGGATLALAAGARRTESAYPRFLRTQRAGDIQVFLTGEPQPADVLRLPNVVDSALATVLPPLGDFAPVVLTDARLGQAINRFKMLAGRPLRPDRPDEAMVGFLLAQRRHLHVGSPLTIEIPATPAAGAQAVTVRVVGIEAVPGEFPPVSTNNLVAYLSPAFLRTPAGAQAAAGTSVALEMTVRLRRGSRDAPAFGADFQRLAGGPGGNFGVVADSSAEVQRSIHVQAVAIWLIAGAIGLAAAFVLFQLLSRQGAEDGGDRLALRTLGMTSGQLFASAMVQTTPLATVGALGAVALAALLSPLLPLGTARVAETEPGFAFDAVTLGLGALALAAVVGLVAAAAAVRTIGGTVATTTAGDTTRLRPRSLEALLTAVRLPLVVATGARLALQSGRGRSAVPTRSTVAAAAVGLGSMVAAVTFAASLGHLLATPRLYGLTFDAQVETIANNGDIRDVVPALRANPAVAAVAVGSISQPLQVGRVNFTAQAMVNVEGAIPTTVTAGRLPSGPDEILLGARTMGSLRAHVGQTLAVAVPGLTGPVPMRVVGLGVLPPVSAEEYLGHGAVITPEAITAYAAMAGPGYDAPPPETAFIRFRPGADKAREMDALRTTANVLVSLPTEPTDVANFGQVRRLPAILAGLLAVMAAFTIAHLLITGIRRRRRELAVLRALGLVPRQISWAIAWQATTVVVVAAVIGLPLGLAVGRTAWAVVAGQIGVAVRPTVPVPLVLSLVPAALLVANLVAFGPAMAAARIRVAPVLRSE